MNPSNTIFCSSCGTKLVSDAQFCDACGSPVIVPTAPTYIPQHSRHPYLRFSQSHKPRLLLYQRDTEKKPHTTGSLPIGCGLFFLFINR